MNNKQSISNQRDYYGSYKPYILGFILSLICTLSAYLLVKSNMLSRKWSIAYLVAVLALVQFCVQLRLFLHLGLEKKPKFKLLVFFFMIIVVLILVGGSIWIIQNLNYRMTPNQINKYIKSQTGGY